MLLWGCCPKGVADWNSDSAESELSDAGCLVRVPGADALSANADRWSCANSTPRFLSPT